MRQLQITKQITNRENQSLEEYLQAIGSTDRTYAIQMAVRESHHKA
jgi:hypothetical protein